MEATTITQLITAGGALGGSIIALIGQHIIKKFELEKIRKQLLFKLIEDELKEKKEIIKPFIQFINSINLPSKFNFYDDSDGLDQVMIQYRNEIKKKVSDFLLDYTLYTIHE